MATKSAAKYKPQEGDRVKVAERAVTADDRKANRYFSHMAGLTGTVQNVYENDEIAVRMDNATLTKATADVHSRAEKRMREKFLQGLSEEGKKQLTSEELNFEVHYVLLVQAGDLEKI